MRSRITLLSLPIAFPLSRGTPSEDDDPVGHHHRLLAGIRDVNSGDRFIVNVHRMRRGAGYPIDASYTRRLSAQTGQKAGLGDGERFPPRKVWVRSGGGFGRSVQGG